MHTYVNKRVELAQQGIARRYRKCVYVWMDGLLLQKTLCCWVSEHTHVIRPPLRPHLASIKKCNLHASPHIWIKRHSLNHSCILLADNFV